MHSCRCHSGGWKHILNEKQLAEHNAYDFVFFLSVIGGFGRGLLVTSKSDQGLLRVLCTYLVSPSREC